MTNPTLHISSVEEIEKAALEVFAKRGFDDTTVEEIAAAAGISRRTFFRYFSSKNDIMFGNFDALIRDLEEWLSSAPDDRPMFDVIADAVMRFNRLHTDGPIAHRERMTLILHTPALRANAALRHADYLAVVARYAARRLREPADSLGPQLVAQVSQGAANAAYEAWLSDKKSDLVELMGRAFDMTQNLSDLGVTKPRARGRRSA
jgi:mycofactocin system transcriptional regulator